MVQAGGTAQKLAIHTTLVHLESGVAGIDGNRDRSHIGKGILKSRLRLGFNVRPAGQGGANIRLVEFAFAVLGRVWIALLGIDAPILLDVFKALVHQTPIAALVALSLKKK